MSLTPAEVNEFVAREYPTAYRAGMRCEQLGEGFAVARWLYDSGTLRPGGLISGPTQFTIADSALWFLSFTILGLAPMAVTSDLHITFLRPALGGDLLARADLIRAGKHRIVGQVEIWVESNPDRRVSHAIGSYALLEPK